jgi:serine protease DegQ
MQRFRILILASLVQACALAQAAMPVPADSRGMPTLAPMLARVTPAVVNISVMARDPAESNPLLRDPFFRRFSCSAIRSASPGATDAMPR